MKQLILVGVLGALCLVWGCRCDHWCRDECAVQPQQPSEENSAVEETVRVRHKHKHHKHHKVIIVHEAVR